MYSALIHPGLYFNFFLLYRNLLLHILNHHSQFFFALLAGVCIDIPGDSLAVGISWGVFALPEVVVELVNAAGACFAVLALVWLEAALIGVLLLFIRRDGSVGLADLMVDFHCRLLLHGVGHMRIDVQRGCRGYMTDDGRQRFHIHAVFQCHSRKGVPFFF